MTRHKHLIALVCLMLMISIGLNTTIYRAFKVNPYQIEVNYTTLKSEQIPETMNDVTLVYFTDLQFGEFQKEKQTKKIFNKIKSLNPDVLLFGGDLIEEGYQINEDQIQFIVSEFNELECPLGKFAVYGEKDLNNSVVSQIYSQSQIEVLSNSYTKITNGSASGIQLMGLTDNVDFINQNASSQLYTLLMVHQPDLLLDCTSQAINYALAGHSHGTQVTVPIKGGYKDVKGATKLNRSNIENLPFNYLISTGVGCTNIQARLMAPARIEYIILKHK
ncbi:metallophosphoesterase [Floccifex sp.]|uniref:metallophosphoesterase n=1 Tax=Floccifex sp. TaxID=2815810 RepID=UPI002A761098|nr:hypothetical protein [Floccifex sp.]MDD7280830.1 hypothetical protein [Erysipelotrichaceae bacterium]MDY2958175.1 hypothetical protein [Floccifex sp.]